MRRLKLPMTLYAMQDGRMQRIGSTVVEVIEWTHHDGARTFLAPYRAH